MFQNIPGFAAQRSALQAYVWYIAMVLVSLVLCSIAGRVVCSFVSPANAPGDGACAGWMSSTALTVIYGGLLLKPRAISAVNLFLVLAGIALATFLGVLGGLVPLAILTTRPLPQPVIPMAEADHTQLA